MLGSQKSGKATRRNNMEYKYQRARTSRVGLVRENQDALCLPRGHLERHRRQHREHVAGVDDFEVATYRAAVARWPAARITLRQGIRVVHD
jgi:hypothetical protein